MSAEFHRRLPSQSGLANRLWAQNVTPLSPSRSSKGSYAQKGTIHDLWHDAIYVLARGDKFDRHLHRVHSIVWDDRREAPRWLERNLPDNHRVDKYYRLFLSVP